MMEISPGIKTECLNFIRFMAAGVLLILVFDLFRILRKLIPHRIGAVAIEDMGYCIGSAIFLFILFCRENDGAVRGFCMLGMAAGMIFCNYAVSPWLVRGVEKVLRKIFRLAAKPVRILGKLAAVPVRFVYRRSHRILRKLQKALKKIRKTIRMVLCKL